MPNTTTDTPCPSTGRHGTRTAYRNDGCRCPEAKAEIARYTRARRKNRAHLVVADPHTLAVGSRRRVHAMRAMGWPEAEIAVRLGYTYGRIPWLRSGGRRIRAHMAARVAWLADELGMQEGPSKVLRERAERDRARGTGGWTMLAWWGIDIDDPDAEPETDASPDEFGEDERDGSKVEDPIAVVLAVSGRPPGKLREVDRKAAVKELLRRRKADGTWMSSVEIGDRIGIPSRSVDRYRAELRLRKCDLDAPRIVIPQQARAGRPVPVGVG